MIIYKLNGENFFQQESKVVSTAEFNQCLWIGKDHSGDKVSVDFNTTLPNPVPICDFESEYPYPLSYTININDEKHEIEIALNPSKVIAVDGLKKILFCF